MDTTYIKMCDCEEIQGQRLFGKAWIQGDRFITEGRLSKWRIASRHKNDIFLPRQDQLQEMVISDPFTGLLNMHFFFVDFVYDETMEEVGCGTQPIEPRKFASMEQLWLAFVMKEKYNKTWDGDKWVKE